jgi:hypothetical protein
MKEKEKRKKKQAYLKDQSWYLHKGHEDNLEKVSVGISDLQAAI